MISKLKNADMVRPLFMEYLSHMSQYFEIDDYDKWHERAMQYVSLYGSEPDRSVYVLKKENVIVGFAFVNAHLRFNQSGFSIGEFYIAGAFRNNGLGRELAEYVFDRFPGEWEVAVARRNEPARLFWRKVIAAYTSNNYQELEIDSYDGFGFIFSSR